MTYFGFIQTIRKKHVSLSAFVDLSRKVEDIASILYIPLQQYWAVSVTT
jgi:hypothetical protein